MEAISFYQGASYLYEHNLYRALSPDEFVHYSQLGEEKASGKTAIATNP